MNNLSSGIIICGIAFVMMFIACKRKWPFIATVALGITVIVFAPPVAIALEKAGILHSYQLSRILVWKNPEAYPKSGGYQVLQGLYAIGSGGLLGKGLGQSIQKLSFLPEPQNDMIFAVICEELGLFGAVAVIFMFLFMLYRFLVIAGNAPDLFGAMLVTGVLVLKKYSFREAALVSVVRILVIGFMFGNLFSILYSLAGAALSMTVMTLMLKNTSFSLIGVSVAGGVSHNIGQLIIAMLIVQNASVFVYAPALLVAGVAAGVVIGGLTNEILKRVQL